MKLNYCILLLQLVFSTCVYESASGLIGSEISESNAELACSENPLCRQTLPLVSYSISSDLASRISCESVSRPVRNCSTKAIVSDSLSSLLDYPLHEDLPSTYWTNSNRLGEYQECTKTPSARWFTSSSSTSDSCETTRKILCACIWKNDTSYNLWSVHGNHFRKISGEFIHCNESLATGSLLYQNADLAIYSPDTVTLANGTSLTAEWSSYQASNTTLERLSSGTFTVTSTLVGTGGIMVNASCVAETTETSSTLYCDILSTPFSVICRQDLARFGGDHGAMYLTVTSYMDFLGVPYPPLPETGSPTASPTQKPTAYPTLLPTKSPSKSPGFRIPTFSPTSSRPSSSPTKSPRKSVPTQSPSSAPTRSPTKAPVVG